MFVDKNKELYKDLLKKIIIIVIGSIVSAYGITLALYAGFGGARHFRNIPYKYWYVLIYSSHYNDYIFINI